MSLLCTNILSNKLTLALFLFSIIHLGCAETGPAENPHDSRIYTIDSNIYFRITIDGDSLINFGIKTLGEPTNSPLLKGSYFVNVDSAFDGSGNLIQNMSLGCIGNVGNLLTQGTLLPQNAFDFTCSGAKPGTFAGSYILFGNPTLLDIRNGSSIEYQLKNGNPYSLTIIGMDSAYAWGELDMMMTKISNSQTIRLKGQFKLNRI